MKAPTEDGFQRRKRNMAKIIDASHTSDTHRYNTVPSSTLSRTTTTPHWWQPLSLGAVMLVSIFMNFYQLGQDGFGGTYYASAIRSMLDSWHNFFFVSYDPGGFVTIDKPPLGFWLQAASAKLFGFTPFSLFLPQALAGILSVLLLFHLVRRHFGFVAGLLAALALSISPISVVTNRNNTIDSTLVLTMLLGAWTVMKAAETGKWRWLLLTATLVGLGFNIKMLEAYLVVPAYGLLYLLASPRSLRMRMLQLFVAALLMLTISLSWVLAVDMTPASQRPYVGSTQNNSELSLALGYNGIERLLGFGGSNGQGGITGSTQQPPTSTGTSSTGNQPPQGFTGQPPQGFNGSSGGPPQGFGGNGGPGGSGNSTGMFNTGNPGVFRLFNEPLGGQIVWLLPLALLGIVALAWQRRPQFRENRQRQSLILWGVWLLTIGIFFSAASFFHQYYLSTLAPAICALFGIGVVVMWHDYRHSGWRSWLLPVALLLTALEQIHIIVSNPSWGTWLIPCIAILCGVAALILFVVRLFPRLKLNRSALITSLGIGLMGLMLTSAVWSAVPGIENLAQDLPTAGPTISGFGSGSIGSIGNFGNSGTDSSETALINYLEAHQGSVKYLVAVASSNQADAIILATNKPVMALGGFTGSDPILTTSQLVTLINNGTVRYFLLGGGGSPGGSSSVTTWVTQHCMAVSSSAWQSTSTTTNNGPGSASQLYSCTASK